MPELLLIAIGAAMGGFVNGLAGFGTGLFALGIWLTILPPEQAVALSVMVAAVTGLQGLWIVRAEIWQGRARLARFLLPALAGIPLGYVALALIRPDALRLVIAAVMLCYAGFIFARGSLPSVTPPKWLDVAVGWVSGVLGGLAGLAGAVLVIYCAIRPWTKRETRAVLQPFNFTVLVLVALAFALRGTYRGEMIPMLGVALLSALCAAQVGIFCFRRLSDTQFRWLITALMGASGALLAWRVLV